MMKVVVGSTNPVKLETTKEAFAQIFGSEAFAFVAFAADSGVPDQPFGSDETKTGAKNRADACRAETPDADFFVGLEGGLELHDEEYWTFAWMCVQDKNGKCGFGRTGSFLLPQKVSELIAQGEELGIATDIAFQEKDTKFGGGTVGILTHGAITRKDFYKEAMLFALIPFLNPDLYSK